MSQTPGITPLVPPGLRPYGENPGDVITDSQHYPKYAGIKLTDRYIIQRPQYFITFDDVLYGLCNKKIYVHDFIYDAYEEKDLTATQFLALYPHRYKVINEYEARLIPLTFPQNSNLASPQSSSSNSNESSDSQAAPSSNRSCMRIAKIILAIITVAAFIIAMVGCSPHLPITCFYVGGTMAFICGVILVVLCKENCKQILNST